MADRFVLPAGSIVAKDFTRTIACAAHLYGRVAETHKTLFRIMMEIPPWPL
jgi:hypothetical protein